MTSVDLSRAQSVLVVDDQADAAASLAIILEMWGYRTQVAQSGQMALRLAGSDLPDVVLLDLGMPDLNGWELAQQLRAIPGMQQALLAMISGYTQPEYRARALASGCDFYLVKPVEPEEIRSILDKREAEFRYHVT
jgi:CheY-like chemotaxis protein